MFFANASQIAQKMKALVEESQPKIVAVHLRGVPDLEYTALKMLTEGVKRQRESGIAVWLVGMNPTVFEMIQKSQLGQMLGSDAMHFNLEIAVAKFLSTAGGAGAS